MPSPIIQSDHIYVSKSENQQEAENIVSNVTNAVKRVAKSDISSIEM